MEDAPGKTKPIGKKFEVGSMKCEVRGAKQSQKAVAGSR
jgi:hypothetical protein